MWQDPVAGQRSCGVCQFPAHARRLTLCPTPYGSRRAAKSIRTVAALSMSP